MNLRAAAIGGRRAAIDERVRSLAKQVPWTFSTQETTIGGVPCVCGSPDRSESASARCIIYVHGGCFVFGTARSFMPIIMEYCRETAATIIAPDYSLAPEHPFPHARDQIIAVYRQLLRDGYHPRRITFLGDSAGANLIMSSLLALRDLGAALPAAAALISPWVDLTLSGDSAATLGAADSEMDVRNLKLYATAYCQCADPRSPYVSPVFATFAELPPLLLQAGTRELLLSDAVRLAEGYRAASRIVFLEIYEGMSHVFHLHRDAPATRAASKSLAEFIRKHALP